MKLPKARSATESIGVNLVDSLVTKELGWLFREQPTDDYGIDAHIEVVEDESVTGRLIAVQIKSGSSYLREATADGFIFRGKIEHLNYWCNHSLPVILVLCDTEAKACYWVQITKENTEKVSEDNWKVFVPRVQILNKKSRIDLQEISMNKTDYERRLHRLVLHRPWMDEIIAGNRLILESDEWINKTSGRGSITLKVIDGETSEEKSVLDWPMVFFPMQSYKDVFPRLFPWADFSVDEEVYEDYDEEDFLLNNATWDNEEDEYIVYGDREQWKKNLPSIRPYTIHSGEVASYCLVLELNRIGQAFIILDDYLKNQLAESDSDSDEHEDEDEDNQDDEDYITLF